MAEQVTVTHGYPHCNTLIWLLRILLKVDGAYLVFSLLELRRVSVERALVLKFGIHCENIRKSVDSVLLDGIGLVGLHIIYDFLLQKSKA